MQCLASLPSLQICPLRCLRPRLCKLRPFFLASVLTAIPVWLELLGGNKCNSSSAPTLHLLFRRNGSSPPSSTRRCNNSCDQTLFLPSEFVSHHHFGPECVLGLFCWFVLFEPLFGFLCFVQHQPTCIY